LIINLARDNPIVLELAQLLRQHLLGCVGQKAAQLTKALDATANQVMDDDRLPLPTDYIESRAEWAPFNPNSFHFNTTIQNSAYLSNLPYTLTLYY
jgi:hypothetical protein